MVRGVFRHTKKGNKPICYSFNDVGCKKTRCTRVHACQICLASDHGAKNHEE